MSQETEVTAESIQSQISELMINTIKDPETGALPEQYATVFNQFATDEDGYPFMQTLAGIVSLVDTTVNYSPSFGYNAEQIAFETANLALLAYRNGWEFVAGAGHFIDPMNHSLLMGTEGYKAHQYYIEQNVIQQIRRVGEQRKQEQPKLILPPTKIVKPH